MATGPMTRALLLVLDAGAIVAIGYGWSTNRPFWFFAGLAGLVVGLLVHAARARRRSALAPLAPACLATASVLAAFLGADYAGFIHARSSMPGTDLAARLSNVIVFPQPA